MCRMLAETPPLHLAATHGNDRLCAILIERGAAINIADGKGRTPLMQACENLHLPAVKVLISHGADVNAKTPSGKSAHSIMLALPSSDMDKAIRAFLREKGAI